MAAVDPAELIALDANLLVSALNRNSPSAALLATRNLQDFRHFEKFHLRLVPRS
jgi:hypothetical protein